MILVKRHDQSEAEYARYLDGIIAGMQGLQKNEGWAMLREQLLHEQRRAFIGMTTATTVDARAMASVEYTTLTRMLEAPATVEKQARDTLAATPPKK